MKGDVGTILCEVVLRGPRPLRALGVGLGVASLGVRGPLRVTREGRELRRVQRQEPLILFERQTQRREHHALTLRRQQVALLDAL